MSELKNTITMEEETNTTKMVSSNLDSKTEKMILSVSETNVNSNKRITESENNLVTFKGYSRMITDIGAFGDGFEYGAWEENTATNIYVGHSFRNSYNYDQEEIKTELTIKKSQINLAAKKVLKVNLVLKPILDGGVVLGYIKANGTSEYIYSTGNNVKIDITNSFNASSGDFLVVLEPNVENRYNIRKERVYKK